MAGKTGTRRVVSAAMTIVATNRCVLCAGMQEFRVVLRGSEGKRKKEKGKTKQREFQQSLHLSVLLPFYSFLLSCLIALPNHDSGAAFSSQCPACDSKYTRRSSCTARTLLQS